MLVAAAYDQPALGSPRSRCPGGHRPAPGLAALGRVLAHGGRRSPSARTRRRRGCVVADDHLVAHRVDQRPAGPHVDIRHQRQPAGRQPGAEQWHRYDDSRRPSIAATRRSMSTYSSTSGPPMSKPARGLSRVEHPDQVTHHVVDRDRLGAGVDPRRGDHSGQMLDELSGHLPRDAAVADDDSGPQDVTGTPAEPSSCSTWRRLRRWADSSSASSPRPPR